MVTYGPEGQLLDIANPEQVAKEPFPTKIALANMFLAKPKRT